MSSYIVDNIKDFNLDHIFDCGQCFRWEKQDDGSYTGIAFDKVVNMQFLEEEESFGNSQRLGAPQESDSLVTSSAQSQDSAAGVKPLCVPQSLSNRPSGRLVIDNCSKEDFEKVWKPYLDLGRDYGKIKEKLTARDPIMKRAVDLGQGIRILRQDLWETIVSFIISQNNNIPRIKGCIENLSLLFGQPAGEYEGRVYYSVPGPKKVASLTAEELAPVRLGYRTKYLIETAKMICEKGLPEDEEQLSALCGVGPKVANCISLFGMGRYDSFPIDVWMARVMSQLYGIDEKDHNGMRAYARKHFGELGGFAQQYLFYYIREKKSGTCQKV